MTEDLASESSSAPYPWNKRFAEFNRLLYELCDAARSPQEARKLYRTLATHQTVAYALYEAMTRGELKAPNPKWNAPK